MRRRRWLHIIMPLPLILPEYQALLPLRLNARGPDNMVIVGGIED
jgi:hypothetical protein